MGVSEAGMTAIDLKFSPEMAKAALEGRKSCTSRRDLKGVPGDIFEIEGVRFRILDVVRARVADVTVDLCKLEGFRTESECARTIQTIYPDLGRRDFLYVHHFARCP